MRCLVARSCFARRRDSWSRPRRGHRPQPGRRRPYSFLPSSAARAPTRADILRGEYGRYRANNDLLLLRPRRAGRSREEVISGKNTIRFRMLKDDTRIQLDLYANLAVDKILLERRR